MSGAVTICSHVKTDGVRCGSPAVSGTAHCHHHSTVKRSLDKVPARGGAKGGDFAPIPFLFVEDRASLQINYFLLLQAFNNHEVDLRTFRLMMSLLKSMGANLGKSGSLVESRDQGSGVRDQKGNRQQATGNREASAVSDQDIAARESVGLSAAAEKRGKAAGVGAFSFAPDYGFLPSVVSAVTVKPWEVETGSDSVREMARKAARVRW